MRLNLDEINGKLILYFEDGEFIYAWSRSVAPSQYEEAKLYLLETGLKHLQESLKTHQSTTSKGIN